MKKVGLMAAVVLAGLITIGANQSANAYTIDVTGATPTLSDDTLSVNCIKVGDRYFNATFTLNQSTWAYDLTTGTVQEDSTCENNYGTEGSYGNFVWKPVSESDGKLVVLLPSSYTGGTQTDLAIYSSSGELLETGSYKGPSNGNRETYRFSNPGSSYGENLTVVITLTDGTKNFWSIPSGGTRVG